MFRCVKDRFDLYLECLIVDIVYGIGLMLGWFVECKIVLYIFVFDKFSCSDGIWMCVDFEWDVEND